MRLGRLEIVRVIRVPVSVCVPAPPVSFYRTVCVPAPPGRVFLVFTGTVPVKRHRGEPGHTRALYRYGTHTGHGHARTVP